MLKTIHFDTCLVNQVIILLHKSVNLFMFSNLTKTALYRRFSMNGNPGLNKAQKKAQRRTSGTYVLLLNGARAKKSS